MNILYIGDVMGEMGLRVVEKRLPDLRRDKVVDLVIAQAENVTEGRGITPKDFERLRAAGVDFCTGGNWTTYRPEIFSLLDDANEPIIRPANYPSDTPGLGYKYIESNDQKILVISLLGQIVGKDAERQVDNPLQSIDAILKLAETNRPDAIIVNFHGDYSSEKVIIGHYLDGRVTGVIGDHWHVPTADAQVLPKGTAHITDVGMCGSLDSSLGVSFASVIPRWRDGRKTQNNLETQDRQQFNAVLVETNSQGLANSIEQIRQIF